MAKRVFCGLVATSLMLATGVGSWAQQPAEPAAEAARPAGEVNPAVVVSLARADKMMNDIGYLTREAGVPEVGGLVTLMAGQFTQGIDTQRPSGLYVTFRAGEPIGVGFIPVRNLDQILQNLREQIGEAQDVGDGIKEIGGDRAEPVYLKEDAGWAFISTNRDALADVPEEPQQMLGDLPEQYNLAVDVHVRNIPTELRERAISELKTGFEGAMQDQRRQDPEGRELQDRVARASLESITDLIEGSEKITVGWAVDAQNEHTYLDFLITAIEGSKLAEQMALIQERPSEVTGFLMEDAAATMLVNSRITDSDRERTLLMLRLIREETLREIEEDENLTGAQQKEQAKEAAGKLFDVVQATVEDGEVQLGMTLIFEPEKMRLAAGGKVTQGTKLEEGLKQLAEVAQDDPEFPEIQFNADTHGDVSFHTLQASIPESERDARRVFGEKLDIVVGTSDDRAFVGIGDGSLELIQNVIDQSEARAEEVHPSFVLEISLTPILEFAASVNDDATLDMVARQARQMEKSDTIVVTETPVERGAQYRIDVAAGVLHIIGQAARIQQQQIGF